MENSAKLLYSWKVWNESKLVISTPMLIGEAAFIVRWHQGPDLCFDKCQIKKNRLAHNPTSLALSWKISDDNFTISSIFPSAFGLWIWSFISKKKKLLCCFAKTEHSLSALLHNSFTVLYEYLYYDCIFWMTTSMTSTWNSLKMGKRKMGHLMREKLEKHVECHLWSECAVKLHCVEEKGKLQVD